MGIVKGARGTCGEWKESEREVTHETMLEAIMILILKCFKTSVYICQACQTSGVRRRKLLTGIGSEKRIRTNIKIVSLLKIILRLDSLGKLAHSALRCFFSVFQVHWDDIAT